jgi:homoserine O-succinyltransferase/O-acetyltransferase
MPVCLDKKMAKRGLARKEQDCGFGVGHAAGRIIRIGLINNMPDGALQATERQFLTLLESAASDLIVHLSFFGLPGVSRSSAGRSHVESFYSSMGDLWESPLDGLIVTGAEPRASSLTEEPFWRGLTRVLEWAEDNTSSTICSCLSAHAAVLHGDGIARRRLSNKYFGVFECERTADHHLLLDVPPVLQVPHSRWNDIPEDDLKKNGYDILTRTKTGVDMFVKQRKSRFVFFQGHPEYQTNTLLLEYKRDFTRYLRHESELCPQVPQNYFEKDAAASLEVLRERALSERSETLLADFPSRQIDSSVRNEWSSPAVRLYRNWLTQLLVDQWREPQHHSEWSSISVAG